MEYRKVISSPQHMTLRGVDLSEYFEPLIVQSAKSCEWFRRSLSVFKLVAIIVLQFKFGSMLDSP